MDAARRELLVARVCSGSTRVRVTDRGREVTLVVRAPSRDHAYAAAELYAEVLRESELEGLFSDDELTGHLVETGEWDEASAKALELLPKQIEESKVALYRAAFKSSERKVIRAALGLAKAELARLLEKKHAYGYLSCSGAAAVARTRYLVGNSLYTADGRRVFADGEFWDGASPLLDDVMAALAAARVGEAEFRELARTEPWRGVWTGHRAEGTLFGVPPPDWTEDQRTLVNWSTLYDNVHQHPECPPDGVLDDDDLLDGWLILQRRDREQRLNAKDGEELVGNEKIRNSAEVYIVADTVGDAKKVVELNDDYGRAVQKQRFTHLRAKGEVNELEMPDTALRLRTEVTAKLASEMSARRG